MISSSFPNSTVQERRPTDTLGYFLPEDEWMTGRNNNYEESVSFGRRAGVTLADALLSLLSPGTST